MKSAADFSPTQIKGEACSVTDHNNDRMVAASIDVKSKSFLSNSKLRLILSNVIFDVYEREFLAILGPSGCGKTTLLRLVAGLDVDYKGSVVVGGDPVLGPGRNRGLMFQESRLLPWLSVERNIDFAVAADVAKSERSERVASALRRVGLSDSAKVLPYQLSGGMAKRAALARAIINIPYLLLLDEPLTALDSPTKYSLQDEIGRIHLTEKQMTAVLVTHDIDEAVYLSDRILVLSPAHSQVLVEIPVPLARPRDRTSEEYKDACSAVSKTIFELWWKASTETTAGAADL